MKKRRLEFLFLYFMIFGAYVVFWWPVPAWGIQLYATVYVATILFSIISLMLENRTSQHTLLWMYVLIFFPIIGYMFYLFSGQLYVKGHLFKSKRMYNREKLRRISELESKPDETRMTDNQRGFFHYTEKATGMHVNTNSDMVILKNGEETFPRLFEELKKAETFIHIEYYMFKSDFLGHQMMEILIDKVKEGVEVRFIYDAAGSIRFSRKDIKRLRQAGVKVAPFLPLKYGFFNQKFNFRNHRKIVIIDGETGFVGGLNVGKEYVGRDESIGFWRDTHTMLKGEAVQTLHSVFMLDWEYVSEEVLIEDPTYHTPHPVTGEGVIQVVPTGPDMKESMSDLYHALISNADQFVWIATPYFVPNESIRTALKIAATRGVDVRVMVPETNDGFLTQYATRSYFPELLKEGIKVYHYQKGFMHQKVMIADGQLASVGTANVDMRSFQLNFEVNVFTAAKEPIEQLMAHYEEDMKECEQMGPVHFYKRGLKERLKESFARLFSGVL